NGQNMPVTMTTTQVITDRNVIHCVYAFCDITDEYQHKLNIEHKAYHDDLTTLPNRMLFQDRVERALAQAKRNNWMVVVLFLDLDDFKPVNDRYGHQIGDETLQVVAARLSNLVREEDTVARVGGDEFAILLPKFGDDVSKLHDFSLKVVECIKEPIQIPPNIEFKIGVSVGVASYPSCGADVLELIKNADVAMYAAKYSGKNNYKLYGGKRDQK
ncbi:MAG: diguanylate cyclase (GGDEF)-like protein, partial [Francisellaceae bacterium]